MTMDRSYPLDNKLDMLDSEPDPLDSESDPLDSEPDPLDSKPDPLDSKPNKCTSTCTNLIFTARTGRSYAQDISKGLHYCIYWGS
jgi:hypothetical protein